MCRLQGLLTNCRIYSTNGGREAAENRDSGTHDFPQSVAKPLDLENLEFGCTIYVNVGG